MQRHDDSGFAYRTPVTPIETPGASTTTVNEQNYNTLKVIQNILDDAIAALSKDFNLFDVLSEGTDEAKKDHMMRLIAGKQIAFDTLSPVKQAVDTAIGTVDNKYKEQ
jgi:hypothetical protein